MKQARGFRGRVALPPPARVARQVRQRGVWRCADEPPKRAPRHLEAGAGTARTALARRVLVVDDETSVRMLCRFNLSAAGMEVREAADGDQALEAIREEAPELLLLDVMMPKRDGWKVAEQLAADPRTREIPIIFLTARVAPVDRERAHELGAVGYIVKPFDPVTLAATVERIIERLERGEREQLQRELLEARD